MMNIEETRKKLEDGLIELGYERYCTGSTLFRKGYKFRCTVGQTSFKYEKKTGYSVFELDLLDITDVTVGDGWMAIYADGWCFSLT